LLISLAGKNRNNLRSGKTAAFRHGYYGRDSSRRPSSNRVFVLTGGDSFIIIFVNTFSRLRGLRSRIVFIILIRRVVANVRTRRGTRGESFYKRQIYTYRFILRNEKRVIFRDKTAANGISISYYLITGAVNKTCLIREINITRIRNRNASPYVRRSKIIYYVGRRAVVFRTKRIRCDGGVVTRLRRRTFSTVNMFAVSIIGEYQPFVKFLNGSRPPAVVHGVKVSEPRLR